MLDGSTDTFPRLLMYQAAAREKDPGIWQTRTWGRGSDEVCALAGEPSLPLLDEPMAGMNVEEIWFKGYAEKQGFHKAVQWRDSGKPIPRGRKGA